MSNVVHSVLKLGVAFQNFYSIHSDPVFTSQLYLGHDQRYTEDEYENYQPNHTSRR